MKFAGILYEALDSTGKPMVREAKVIGELPLEDRQGACVDAAKGIGESIGLTPVRTVPFGAPVYEAFGLTRPQAKAHSQAELLLKLGHQVPLSYCG